MNSNVEGDDHTQNRAGGTTFQLAGVVVTLKATGPMTDDAFAVVEWVLPAYHKGLWPHLHRRSSEALYVVQGALACTLNEETMVLRAGAYLDVTPGAAHHIWNPAAAPVTYLTLFVPAGPEAYLQTLAKMPVNQADQGRTEHTLIHCIGGRYDYFATADRR